MSSEDDYKFHVVKPDPIIYFNGVRIEGTDYRFEEIHWVRLRILHLIKRHKENCLNFYEHADTLESCAYKICDDSYLLLGYNTFKKYFKEEDMHGELINRLIRLYNTFVDTVTSELTGPNGTKVDFRPLYLDFVGSPSKSAAKGE